MQFSTVENRFIVKLKLNSAFTNDLKKNIFFPKKVHSYRLSHFDELFNVFPNLFHVKV